jgi:hypothetical protein
MYSLPNDVILNGIVPFCDVKTVARSSDDRKAKFAGQRHEMVDDVEGLQYS